MISEECDAQDWRNYAENSALHDRNKLHFNIYIYIYIKLFSIVVIFHNITVLTVFLYGKTMLRW